MRYPGATLYLHTSGLSKELLEESHCYSQLVVAVWLHRCAPLSDVVDQATKFIGACYGNRVGGETMSDIR